jgi:hypothetical protein
MKSLKTRFFTLLSIILIIFLSSCGGGGSSSGGGVSKAATPFAGQYSGTEVLQVSGPGGTFPLGTFPLSIAIAIDGGVIVTDADGIPHVGKLGDPTVQQPDNQFVATAFVSIPSPPGIFCLPSTYAYFGTVVGNNITGNTNGSFFCTGQGARAILVVGGPFSATRNAVGTAPPGATPSTTQFPGSGGLRKSRKQKAISDGVGSVF